MVLNKGILPTVNTVKNSILGWLQQDCKKRIGEHKKSEQSAIYNHSADTGHIIENSEALSTYKIKYRLKLKKLF